MKTVVEAWGQADLEPVRAALDQNVVWNSASTCKDGDFRFGGIYRGKSNVLALLALLSANYFFERYTTKEIISRGEIVWGLFDTAGAYIPTGGNDQDRRPIHFETAFRWRIRDGKILEAQSFFDTAALLVQQGNLRVAAAVA